MNFLFDHNLPPSWARALDVLSVNKFKAGDVGQVISLRDKFPINTIDVVWLQTLKEEGNWTVISSDTFRKNNAERELVRSRGLNIFVLRKMWATQPHWAQTVNFIEWWPRIVSQANTVEKTYFEIPWKSSGKFTHVQ